MKPNNGTKLDQALKMSSNKMFKMCVIALIVLTLFTLTQAYYKYALHLGLLVLCFLCCGKAQKQTVFFLGVSIVTALLFAVMSLMKGHGLTMEHITFFSHHATWPFVFIGVVHNFDKKEIKKLLYFILALCLIGNILSLLQLFRNPEISRELAGAMHGSERSHYYKMGVGGYGHVFCTSFLVFGIIRWLKKSTDKKEKIFLVMFLVSCYLYILYASYTTAIVITVILTVLALIVGMKSNSRIFMVVLIAVLVLVFTGPILEMAHDLANNLGLEWVAKRFAQIINAQSDNDMSSLRRYQLYKESWDTFALRPIFGAIQDKGDTWGGHSQLLDAFAQYGLFTSALLVFWHRCRRTSQKYIPHFKLGLFYIVFYVFSAINTCAAMQIPVVVFFVVPLIAYMESEGKLNENRDTDLSLGS